MLVVTPTEGMLNRLEGGKGKKVSRAVLITNPTPQYEKCKTAFKVVGA
jgi:hypothetical protein